MTDYEGVDMGNRTNWRGTPEERFWRRVNKAGPYNPVIPGGRSAVMGTHCWQWTGPTNGKTGYAQIWVGESRQVVHRFSYELTGSISDEMVLDHLCRNRLCVNPDHLEATTQAVNIQRQGPRPSVSGHRNVYWNKARRVWDVRIRYDGKAVYGGNFTDLAAAAAVAEALRSQLHG